MSWFSSIKKTLSKGPTTPSAPASDEGPPPPLPLPQLENNNVDGGEAKPTVVIQTNISRKMAEDILEHLKGRFLDCDETHFSLDELCETVRPQVTLGKLLKDATLDILKSSKRIKIVSGKLMFKPPYSVETVEDLLKIIRKASARGEGVLSEDIADSTKAGQSMIWALQDKKMLTVIQRWDGKQALFILPDDYMTELTVDEGFKSLFHSVNVAETDYLDVEKYLRKNHHKLMEVGKPMPMRKINVQQTKEQMMVDELNSKRKRIRQRKNSNEGEKDVEKPKRISLPPMRRGALERNRREHFIKRHREALMNPPVLFSLSDNILKHQPNMMKK